MPVEVSTQNSRDLRVIALRPFRHEGKTIEIGEEAVLAKSDALHIIASGKALEATPEAKTKAAQAKAEAAERLKRLEQQASPKAAAGSVNVQALTAEITKAVRETLIKEMELSIAELNKAMAAEVKKQVEEAAKKK